MAGFFDIFHIIKYGRAILLESVTDLLQSALGFTNCDGLLLQSASGITKCDRLYYKVRQVLQSATVITK